MAAPWAWRPDPRLRRRRPLNEDIDISAAFEEQPDVETVEVADRAVALADDLDIPELAEEEELPRGLGL